MSIASIGNYANAISYSSNTSSASVPSSTSSTASSTSSSDSADLVTLSPEALGIARLNAAGITLECVSASSLPNLQQLAASGLQSSSGSSSTKTTSPANGELSEALFAKVLAGYGATSTQADTYFSEIDTNDNGEISNGELLTALGDTGSDTGSSLSQGLLTLMNTSHSGVVSGTEFVAFETSLVTAETPTATA